MAALAGRGLQEENLLSQGTLHNHGFEIEAKPYQMLARLSCLATEWRHSLHQDSQPLPHVVHCGSSGSKQ